ncbi:MAG: PorT family protein [Flavobacteriales bacterium]|nr:PorT family protein [Flavobacteriales bacterium]
MKHILYILIAVLLINLDGFAQVKKKGKTSKGTPILNLEKFDRKKIHFGFALGFNTADFIMETNLNDSLLKLESQRQSGFNLGIITDLHMGPYFDLRFVPTLAFAQRNLEYTYQFYDAENPEVLKKEIESTFLNFPLNLKYRSVRQTNFAAYIIGGGSYSFDLASQHKTDNSNAQTGDIVIKLNRHSYLWEVGVGFDFFLEYFKFSTELKMSYGINNIAVNDNTMFSEPISSLKSKIFTLSFNFEG